MKDSSITNTIHNLIKEFEFRDLFNLNPIFKAEIMSYIDLIKKSSDSNTLSYQKTFEIKIKIPHSDEFYYLEWEVKKPFYYQKKNQILKINTQGIFCSKENINTQILSHYIKNIQTEPIIIARHLPINKLLIIDGNHRYEAALNRKDQFINCIILEPTEHLPYLISDRMKTFYKVHHNLFVLINLCYNPALRNSIAFNESLGANTYYRLLNSL